MVFYLVLMMVMKMVDLMVENLVLHLVERKEKMMADKMAVTLVLL